MLKNCTDLLKKFALLLSCCAISACVTAGNSHTLPGSPKAALIERVIVQLKSPTDPASQITQLAERYQLGMAYEREMGSQFYVATLKPALSNDSLQPYLAQIAQDPAVASIEADLPMHTMPVQ
jgi:hypothetical protein